MRLSNWFCGLLRSVALVAAMASPAWAKPGLLLVAHGAPNPAWNKPVVNFGERVAKQIAKDGKYKAVRTAMLEFTKPDIPAAVAELEAEGCDRIVAIPLFLAPTGHTHFDVPAALGIYSSPKTTATLAAEGAKAAKPRVPVLLTQTLADSDVLSRYALDEVLKLSKSPGEEAIVLLVHGDPEHELLVEQIMRRVATHCCGNAKIAYGDWASIGVGQEYPSNGIAAIQNALSHRPRAIVVGLYLSTTAAAIHQRAMKSKTPGHGGAAGDPFPAKRVAMSDDAVITHPALLQWVLKTADDTAGEPKS